MGVKHQLAGFSISGVQGNGALMVRVHVSWAMINNVYVGYSAVQWETCLLFFLLNIVWVCVCETIWSLTIMPLHDLAGGYNREECLRTVECYDPKEDQWTFIAPMRTPRARFQMAVLMVQFSILCQVYLFYIIGIVSTGLVECLHLFKPVLVVHCEKLRLMYPHLIPPLTGSAVCDRRFKRTFGRAELWGEIWSICRWVVSGTRAEDKPLQCRWVHCAWLHWAPPPSPGLGKTTWGFNACSTHCGYVFKGVCSLNNKLYVVGGSDPCGQKGLKNCDAFDPVSKAWSNCASLNISMYPQDHVKQSRL